MSTREPFQSVSDDQPLLQRTLIPVIAASDGHYAASFKYAANPFCPPRTGLIQPVPYDRTLGRSRKPH